MSEQNETNALPDAIYEHLMSRIEYQKGGVLDSSGVLTEALLGENPPYFSAKQEAQALLLTLRNLAILCDIPETREYLKNLLSDLLKDEGE